MRVTRFFGFYRVEVWGYEANEIIFSFYDCFVLAAF